MLECSELWETILLSPKHPSGEKVKIHCHWRHVCRKWRDLLQREFEKQFFPIDTYFVPTRWYKLPEDKTFIVKPWLINKRVASPSHSAFRQLWRIIESLSFELNDDQANMSQWIRSQLSFLSLEIFSCGRYHAICFAEQQQQPTRETQSLIHITI